MFLEPSVYRAIIDDVMANIKNDFDDHGVNEDILADLQNVRFLMRPFLKSFLS